MQMDIVYIFIVFLKFSDARIYNNLQNRGDFTIEKQITWLFCNTVKVFQTPLRFYATLNPNIDYWLFKIANVKIKLKKTHKFKITILSISSKIEKEQQLSKTDNYRNIGKNDNFNGEVNNLKPLLTLFHVRGGKKLPPPSVFVEYLFFAKIGSISNFLTF